MSFLKDYALLVLDGKIVACDKIKRVYERLLNDAENPGRWHLDTDIGDRPIQFIEKFCKQSQGKIGEPLSLQLYQKAMLETAFGTVDDNVIRRYNEILNIIGRKNGKTTLLSGIQLYMLLADGEGAPECYQIATAKDQARKGYRECCNMRLQSPLIRRHVRKRQEDLYCDENMGFIKALASDTNHLDSLNSHCVVIDELHAIKNRDLYDLMKQSMASREQPMLWEITTNGFVRNGIYDAQYKYATGVLDGTIADERFLPIIYELDSREEWDKPDMWIKANPGLGTVKKESFLRGCVEKAKSDPTFLPTVLVKDFNVTENAAQTWLTWDELQNEQTFDVKQIRPKYGIGGMDAADSVDLNAAKMLFKRRDDPNLYVLQHYWIPETKLEQTKSRKNPDDAPYELWQAQGLITVCEGNRVDKRVFLDFFLQLRDEEDIYPLYIGYDPWHIDEALLSQFKQEFGDSTMIPIRQGVKTLSQPMKDLKAEFQGHRVVYNDNPIDQWCLSNTYTKVDVNGNIQPDKGQQATKRIDGTAALLDAYVVLTQKGEEYESLI